MAIRKPTLSVTEAKRRANVRSAATGGPIVNIEPIATDIHPRIPSNLSTAKTPSPRPTRAKEIAQPVAKPSPRLFVAQADKVQVFVSALLPAVGVSPVFETLCRHHPPQKALQMILRRALHDYDEMLKSGTFQNATVTYATDDTAPAEIFVQTSRMMPVPLLALARAHFDPLGLESTRAFGRKLATAALAAFFARELKRPI